MRMNLLRLSVLLLLAGSAIQLTPAGAQIRQAWAARMSQDPNVRDTATSMAVDSAGQVYVTGRTENTNTLHRFNEYLTAKFGSDGGLRWAARYRGATNGDNYAEVLRLDSDGNCYVTGSSVTNDVQSTREIATVKYDPEGHQLWVSRVGTRPENFPKALALGMHMRQDTQAATILGPG